MIGSGGSMNKNKILTLLLILLTAIISVGSIYLVISYAIDILNAVEDFIKLNDLTKLTSCGATLPPQLSAIAGDSEVMALAVLYGLPVLLILVSALMFIAGFYYHKGRLEDEEKKREEIERDMVRKAAERVARQKAKEAEEAASRAMEEELEEPKPESAVSETESEMIVRKKRK